MAAPHVAGYATVVKGLFPSAGATAVAAAVVGSATPNVLSYVSSNTANKLLFVGLARCDVAALAGVVCSALAAPAPAPAPAAPVPTKVTLITSKTPATATNLAKTARLTVPTGAKVSVKVASSASRYCKVRSNKVYAVRSGTCTMSVTVAAKGKKTVTKTLKIKVKK
jgi:hypothetical protein